MLLFWNNIAPTITQLFIYLQFFLNNVELTIKEIKKRILIKLVRWRKWGGAHTENIIGGLPAHLKGAKITKQALKELEKGGLILPAMKTGETHYSLNPRKKAEIYRFLGIPPRE